MEEPFFRSKQRTGHHVRVRSDPSEQRARTIRESAAFDSVAHTLSVPRRDSSRRPTSQLRAYGINRPGGAGPQTCRVGTLTDTGPPPHTRSFLSALGPPVATERGPKPGQPQLTPWAAGIFPGLHYTTAGNIPLTLARGVSPGWSCPVFPFGARLLRSSGACGGAKNPPCQRPIFPLSALRLHSFHHSLGSVFLALGLRYDMVLAPKIGPRGPF